jgi:diacylglycerol kinase family enzyme
MSLFNRAGKGRHIDSDRVEMLSSGRFVVRSAGGPVRFEVDGDVFLSSEPEVEVEVLPGRLPIVTA